MRPRRDSGAIAPRLVGGVGFAVATVAYALWWLADTSTQMVGLLVLAVVVPVVLVGGYLLQEQRDRAARRWAATVGWTFVGEDPALRVRWHQPPFGIGTDTRATEAVRGVWQGRPAVSFRYRYATGGGRAKTVVTYHVVALELPARLTPLEILPESLGSGVAKAFGARDIQFESADFNAQWRVVCADAKFAHDVVHPRLMERLLRPDARGAALRIEDRWIVSWRLGLPDLAGLPARLSAMAALADAVPRFVWQEHGHDPLAPQAGATWPPR